MGNEKELIYLVDDNPANLRTGKNVLSEKYTVFTAPSAEKMFGLLEMESNRPALILLDIDMPEMDGYDAIKQLKSKPETKDIPVIFLTGKNESDDEITGLSLGAIDYITKPFQPALLLKRIEVHLLVESQKKSLEYYGENLRAAFERYLAPDVINELINDPSKLKLGGEKRVMTALFTDIYNFSGISERLDPARLVTLFNEYFTEMSGVIMECRGTIDKFVGDAIVAFFGAPVFYEDHAALACQSAIRMKRAERELNKRMSEQGFNIAPLFTRIGINTGDMVVGNMGTASKMNYTIMGNAVNLASRLEGINKYYGSGILAAEDTVKVAGNGFLVRRLDRIRVAGIQEPVRIYEILELIEDAPDETRKLAELFREAQELFEAREWAAAEAAFSRTLGHSPDDGPSLFYLVRCRKFQETPPPADWDGVFNLAKSDPVSPQPTGGGGGGVNLI